MVSLASLMSCSTSLGRSALMLGLASQDFSVEPSVAAEIEVFGQATGGQYHQAMERRFGLF